MKLEVGMAKISRKGLHLFLGFYGKFGVWMYGVEVLLKFVDLIFPGCTVDIINIPDPPFD